MSLPKRPESLPALAESTLNALSGHPLAANIVLGGGIALKHYNDIRPTQDIDAWWLQTRDEPTLAALEGCLDRVASAEGLVVQHRYFGTTDSFDFSDLTSSKKSFAFQIAVRDVPLESSTVSSWPPIRLETLRDNVGSKMNALVNRGAPRDFVDIHGVVEAGLLTIPECWELWSLKNSGLDLTGARGRALSHLARLEQRRPIDSIEPLYERARANELRIWFKEHFLSFPSEERS